MCIPRRPSCEINSPVIHYSNRVEGKNLCKYSQVVCIVLAKQLHVNRPVARENPLSHSRFRGGASKSPVKKQAPNVSKRIGSELRCEPFYNKPFSNNRIARLGSTETTSTDGCIISSPVRAIWNFSATCFGFSDSQETPYVELHQDQKFHRKGFVAGNTLSSFHFSSHYHAAYAVYNEASR